MSDVKISREYLIRETFLQYIKKGYTYVSISVLQKELHIGRATVYYYFEDKQKLFEAVVEEYLLRPLKESSVLPTDAGLENLICSRLDIIAKKRAFLKELGCSDKELNNLISLAMVAFVHYEPYRNLLLQMQIDIRKAWCVVLQKEIEAGSIRPDIDVDSMAQIFANVKANFDLTRDQKRMEDEQIPIKSYRLLYDLIRVKK